MIVCGQQSLEVFCFGVFLAVAAHVVLVEISSDIWMQIVVSAVGIALMTALAYYRSWSKNADKKPAKAWRGIGAAVGWCKRRVKREMRNAPSPGLQSFEDDHK